MTLTQEQQERLAELTAYTAKQILEIITDKNGGFYSYDAIHAAHVHSKVIERGIIEYMAFLSTSENPTAENTKEGIEQGKKADLSDLR